MVVNQKKTEVIVFYCHREFVPLSIQLSEDTTLHSTKKLEFLEYGLISNCNGMNTGGKLKTLFLKQLMG